MKRLTFPLLVSICAALVLFTSACQEQPAVAEKEEGLPYNLVVAPGRNAKVGTYFVLQGIIPEDKTIPEASRSPAQQFAAALYCGSTWAHPSAQQMPEYNRFRNWLSTSGAKQDPTHIALEDIRISCEADSTIQFKSSDFQRSLALLASGFEGERTLTRGKEAAADHFQFFSDGSPLSIRVTPEDVRAVEGEGGTTVGTATARQGTNTAPLTGDGAGAFKFDPAQPLEVIVQRQGQRFWDVLTVRYNEGAFGWRQTVTDPVKARR